MMRFSSKSRVYLLRKSQMNGSMRSSSASSSSRDLKAAPKPLSLSVSYYKSTSTDDEPGLSLSRRFGTEDATFYLCFRDAPDGYEFYLGEPQEPGSKLRAALEDEGFEERKGRWIKLVSRSGMKAAVLSLDRALQQQA